MTMKRQWTRDELADHWTLSPRELVVHVGNGINIPADLHPRYEWSGRTIEYHRAQIREILGFREATVQDANELVALAD